MDQRFYETYHINTHALFLEDVHDDELQGGHFATVNRLPDLSPSDFYLFGGRANHVQRKLY